MIIILLFAASICISITNAFYNAHRKKQKLVSHKCYTKAKIARFISRHKGLKGFEYEFSCDGKKYINEYPFPSSKVPFDNKTFVVVYECDNPDNNALLIFPEDFEAYHETFPDSLKWVQEYVVN